MIPALWNGRLEMRVDFLLSVSLDGGHDSVAGRILKCWGRLSVDWFTSRRHVMRATSLVMRIGCGVIGVMLVARGAWAGEGGTVNWPSFRGANASGVSEGFATVTSWSVESGENVKWKTPIPGL